MKIKYFSIILIFPLFLSGCGLFSNIENIPSQKGLSFAIPSSQNENEYWMNPEKLIQDVNKKYDLLSEKSEEIQSFDSALKSWDLSEDEIKRNVITKYTLGDETYELVGVKFADPQDNIPEEFAVQLNGKVLFQKAMCFGAEGPIQDFRKVNGKVAITYVEGICNYDGKKKSESKLNIFYDGKIMNEEYNVEASHYLFVYKDKIGFVAGLSGKEYIYFNGKKVSDSFDSIPTSQCCMTVSPVFKLYENGALLFRGSRESNYYLIEVDLNEYL